MIAAGLQSKGDAIVDCSLFSTKVQAECVTEIHSLKCTAQPVADERIFDGGRMAIPGGFLLFGFLDSPKEADLAQAESCPSGAPG